MAITLGFEVYGTLIDAAGIASALQVFAGEKTAAFAARVINEIRKRCLDMAAKDMRLAGELLLIPRNQMHRFDG